MRFYSKPSEHVEMLASQLSAALGVEVKDYFEISLDEGKTQVAYVIGDANPLGISAMGQEIFDLEIELRIFSPVTKEVVSEAGAQRYALDLSAKVVSLLNHCSYGLDNQRERPVIESNDALSMKYHESRQYCQRSVVFRQKVYAGDQAVELLDVHFEEVS